MDEAVTHAPDAGEAPMGRRLLAEFVGTLIFVAVGTGAATVAGLRPLQEITEIANELGGPLGPQEPFISNILEGGLGGVFPVAFAFATVLAVLVYAMGGVSGAHFNPAVTFSLAVARRFRWKDLPGYVIVQCLGAIAGAFVIAGIYGTPLAAGEPAGADVLFGATTVAQGINDWQALLAEAFITFLLVTGIMAVAIDPRAPKGWSGLIIGLALAGGILVTAHATGGSANFARSLGPFVASLAYDLPEGVNIPWEDLIIYAAGPLIGGAAAALVYEGVTGLELVAPAPSPGAATPPGDDVLADATHDHGPEESHAHTHGREMHSHPHDHAEGPGHDHPH